MLTKTTETAIMALLYLTMREDHQPTSPRQVSGQLGLSSSYLAKIFTRLAKAGILRAHRGVQGGVTLARPPAEITLLQVVDACQGPLVEDLNDPQRRSQCNFHQAVTGFENSVRSSLSDWTLERLANDPCPAGPDETHVSCRVAEICPKRREQLNQHRDRADA